LWWFDDEAVPTLSSDPSFACPPCPTPRDIEFGFAAGNLGGFSGEGAKSENVPVERLLK
jgi:hypothetical protein